MPDPIALKCDVAILGGSVIDGSGEPRIRADVAVSGDRVVAVGEFGNLECREQIQAGGKIVAPGFIDAHTHDDRALLSSPDMKAKVSQGVTTVVAGNCGVSLAPLVGRDPPPPLNLLGGRDWYRFAAMADYINAVEADPPAVNAALLVGHSTLRAGVMNDLARPATDLEVGRMGELVDASMEAGCIGFSTGLGYPTAEAAPTDEVVALAAHVHPFGGIYATHMRDEGKYVVEAVQESLNIGARAEVPVVISHHKASGRANWGLTKKTLALIADAKKTQSIDFDVYPYIASSTVLLMDFVGEAERVTVTWSEPCPEVAGQDLDDVCAQWGCTVEHAIERLSPAGAIYHQMHEDDLQRVLRFPGAMIGSDGLPHDVFPHPRLWGTFPRVLGHYCRELALFPLEEAVHRMTGASASVFGLQDRGVIREGAFADLVVFNPDTIIDSADFTNPTQTAAGIELVMVNGKTVWDGEETTGQLPGRVVRRV